MRDFFARAHFIFYLLISLSANLRSLSATPSATEVVDSAKIEPLASEKTTYAWFYPRCEVDGVDGVMGGHEMIMKWLWRYQRALIAWLYEFNGWFEKWISQDICLREWYIHKWWYNLHRFSQLFESWHGSPVKYLCMPYLFMGEAFYFFSNIHFIDQSLQPRS